VITTDLEKIQKKLKEPVKKVEPVTGMQAALSEIYTYWAALGN
jgi:hypothetical protein